MSGHNHTPGVQEHADSWHHHTRDEGVPQHEHLAVLNTVAIARWGVLIAVALVVVMVAIGAYFSSYVTQLKHDREEREAWQRISQGARGVRETSDRQLSTGDHAGKAEYSWAPEGGDRVQIPIEQAMGKVVKNYEKR